MILHKHRQYAYQMKAEIILNSYLLPKISNAYESFWKKLKFKIFLPKFSKEKKISIANFSKKIFYNPQISFEKWF